MSLVFSLPLSLSCRKSTAEMVRADRTESSSSITSRIKTISSDYIQDSLSVSQHHDSSTEASKEALDRDKDTSDADVLPEEKQLHLVAQFGGLELIVTDRDFGDLLITNFKGQNSTITIQTV